MRYEYTVGSVEPCFRLIGRSVFGHLSHLEGTEHFSLMDAGNFIALQFGPGADTTFQTRLRSFEKKSSFSSSSMRNQDVHAAQWQVTVNSLSQFSHAHTLGINYRAEALPTEYDNLFLTSLVARRVRLG